MFNLAIDLKNKGILLTLESVGTIMIFNPNPPDSTSFIKAGLSESFEVEG